LKQILVVDDDASIRELFHQYLSHAGYQVTAAKDGLDVMSKFVNNDFDAVIADYSMPGINGVELIRKLRTFKPEINAILLSASRLEPVAAEENVYFLHKPANMETLVDYLSIILSGTG